MTKCEYIWRMIVYNSNALVAGYRYRLTIKIQKWHYRSWPCRRYDLRQPIETVQIIMRR